MEWCAFFLPKIPALKRVGPHKKEIYSVLTGSMLGDGYGEMHGRGARFHLHYSHKNVEYVMFLHKIFTDNGYCSLKKPNLRKIIGKKGKIYYSLRFHTFSFGSFKPFYLDWYFNEKGLKQLPTNLKEFLTPLALAVWVMDDGSFTGFGVKLATDSFTQEEVLRLIEILKTNFNLKANLQCQNSRWRIYIPKSSMPVLIPIIEPYMAPSMKYKLGLISS